MIDIIEMINPAIAIPLDFSFLQRLTMEQARPRRPKTRPIVIVHEKNKAKRLIINPAIAILLFTGMVSYTTARGGWAIFGLYAIFGLFVIFGLPAIFGLFVIFGLPVIF